MPYFYREPVSTACRTGSNAVVKQRIGATHAADPGQSGMLARVTWYPLLPCDASFFSTAPYAYHFPVELSAPPERVWSSLTSTHALADWGLPIRRLEWTSPRPLGVGATREIELSGNSFALREHFFRWDEGTRYCFYGVQCNRPVLRRFAEDYVIEKTPGGSRFTWTIALEPADRWRRLLQVAAPLNSVAFRAVPMRAKAYFARNP
jgi:hypothetical protein